MSAGYKMEEVLKEATAQTVGASATDETVSDVFRMSGEDSLNFIVRINISAITVNTGLSAKLYESYDGSTFIASGKTVALAATGNVEMKVKADDTEVPLLPQCKIVVSTGVGDSVTIDSILISRRL